MKVRDLIAQLSKLDPDGEVEYGHEDHFELFQQQWRDLCDARGYMTCKHREKVLLHMIFEVCESQSPCRFFDTAKDLLEGLE